MIVKLTGDPDGDTEGVPEGVEGGVIDGDGEAVVTGGELTGDVVEGEVVAGVVVLPVDVQADREIRTDVTKSKAIIIVFALNLIFFIFMPPLTLYTFLAHSHHPVK